MGGGAGERGTKRCQWKVGSINICITVVGSINICMVGSINICMMYHSGIGQRILMEDGTLPQTSKHVSKNYCFTLYNLPLLTSTFIIHMN